MRRAVDARTAVEPRACACWEWGVGPAKKAPFLFRKIGGASIPTWFDNFRIISPRVKRHGNGGRQALYIFFAIFRWSGNNACPVWV